jgi:hypothetical protein
VSEIDRTVGVRSRIVVVVVWIVHRRAEVLQRLIVVVVVGVVREEGEALFRFGFADFNVQRRGLGGNWGSGACSLLLSRTLLPFKDTGPVG